MVAINSKNLMIGDWVIYHPNVLSEEDSYPVQIEGGKDIDRASTDECFYPIELTTELLLKNGFEQDGNMFYFDNNTKEDYVGFCIGKISNCFVFFTNFRTIAVQYVHQLQHLLRECDVDDDIDFTVE